MDRVLYMITTEYISKVIEAIDIMKKGLGVDSVSEVRRYWIENGQLGSFVLDDIQYDYFFHGIGCRLTF